MVKTKIHQIAYSYYRRKPSELLVLSVEKLIQTLFSIGMKQLNYLLFISKAVSSDSHRYETSCSSKGFLKVNIANTKKYGREALINSTMSSWNDIQKYFSSNKRLRDVPTFKLKSLLTKHFPKPYNTS